MYTVDNRKIKYYYIFRGDWMRKDLKTRTPVNCAVDNELNEKLVELSKETMIPKSKLLDVAIKLLLEKYKK